MVSSQIRDAAWKSLSRVIKKKYDSNLTENGFILAYSHLHKLKENNNKKNLFPSCLSGGFSASLQVKPSNYSVMNKFIHFQTLQIIANDLNEFICDKNGVTVKNN